jgi:hypothetical protein
VAFKLREVLLLFQLVSVRPHNYGGYYLQQISGAGVIGDITTARERGGLIGIFGGSKLTPLMYQIFY